VSPVAARPDPVDERTRVDDLRRRLYRADATAEDLERYRAELESVEPAAPEATPSAPQPRRVTAAAIALAVVAVVVLVLAVRLGQPAEQTAPSTFGPAPTADAERVVGPARDAGGATILPVVIDGTTVAGQRFRGVGRAHVDVDAPQGAFDGGRMLIHLTTGGSQRLEWRAVAFAGRPDWTSRVEIASGAVWTPFGSTAPTPIAYPAQPPTRIEIDAPQGAGWTLVVAFVDSNSPVEH
jgi:hypothetical protein